MHIMRATPCHSPKTIGLCTFLKRLSRQLLGQASVTGADIFLDRMDKICKIFGGKAAFFYPVNLVHPVQKTSLVNIWNSLQHSVSKVLKDYVVTIAHSFRKFSRILLNSSGFSIIGACPHLSKKCKREFSISS